jgi:hypothetical protein
MTIQIQILGLALQMETRRVRYRRVRFGRPAPDLVVGAAALIGAVSVLIGMGQIAGVL